MLWSYGREGQQGVMSDALLALPSDISSGEGAAATCKFLTQRITGVDDLDFLIHIGDVRDFWFYLSRSLIRPPSFAAGLWPWRCRRMEHLA